MPFFSNEPSLCALRPSLAVYTDKVKLPSNKVAIEHISGLMPMKVKSVMYWREDKHIWSTAGIDDGVRRNNACVPTAVVVKKINRRTNKPKRKCSCSDEHASNKKSFLKISKTFHLKIQFTATECFVTNNNCNRTSNKYRSTIKLGRVFITIQHNSTVCGCLSD